jgi:hypothetical protein
MTLWEVFAPLLHALWGGRVGVPTPDRSGPLLSFEPEWAPLLGQLRLPPRALRDVVVTDRLEPHFHYRHYNKRKKGGGTRAIVEPDACLKRLQQVILARYLTPCPVHPAATAYQRGRSIADHVWTHAGAEVLITADLEDFFPSTQACRVEDWWRERVGDADLVRLLTRLTTHQGGLPQGAPTSPALSNLVNHELDERLTRRADLAGARYSRYCDDLAFSWPRGGEPPSDFRHGVVVTLLEFGYRLHPTKGWCLHTRGDEPEVTGVILTRRGKVRLPARLREIMARLARSRDPADGQRLEGYRAYEVMVTRRHPGVPAPAPLPSLPPPLDLVSYDEDIEADEEDDEIPF